MNDTEQDSPIPVPAHVFFDAMICDAIQHCHEGMTAQQMADILITHANKISRGQG